MLRNKTIIIATLLTFLPCLTNGQRVFDRNGKPFAKQSQRTQEPKQIVDTVKITAGVGRMVLNNAFTKSKHKVSATSDSHFRASISQILTDTSNTVYYYGYYISKNGDTLIVKSSGGTADTGYVSVSAILK